ncbi:MAG: FtsW/RodA/SpoVE family cell cycle protein [Campylobacter sp.]|nr:FtsW/RodA/SpoVE family cell cycle protein [Campylobacter sp.]
MRADRKLFFITVILISVGIVFSLSLSVFDALKYDYDKLHFFKRQFVVGMFGVLLIWCMSHLKSQLQISILCFSALIITTILIFAMPFMPASMVTEVNGANRWIRLPGFSFSPIEFFKIGFIYFLAWSFTRRIGDQTATLKQQLKANFPYSLLFLIVIFIIATLQNDIGQVVVLVGVLLMMILLAGISFRLVLFFAIPMSFFLVIFLATSEHRIRRIQSWWAGGASEIFSRVLPAGLANKLKVEDVEAPYQVGHSLNAINNGGLFGEGLGEGMFKLGFLSEVHTDFVLSGITEEIGFVGLGVIVFCFYYFLKRVFAIAANSTNKVYFLFCGGLGFMFLFSFLINSFGTVSITPVKGLAVPFISYGGTHLMAACFGVGAILMMSKFSNYKG